MCGMMARIWRNELEGKGVTMRAIWLVGVIAIAANPVGKAFASGEGGMAVAERLCAECHAVSPAVAESPHPKAPPFVVIAKRWPPEYLAEALAEGIVVAHDAAKPMPEFSLNHDEIDALIDYLQGLREGHR
ncbi:MAG: cytochrome C [Rhodospirillaceae bacterium]|jgi:cytochrome c|nr:cytochrome C [Rhodospirillaceae bacterium]|tara:strand:- start:234 stop:626 length:393 start_codon:yes stop_codon:yes gene_type:complete